MNKKDLSVAEIFGVSIFSNNHDYLLENTKNSVFKGVKRGVFWINTPNAEQLVMASNDDTFRSILNRANLCIPDGISLVLASKLMKFFGKSRESIKERITGVDLMQDICRLATENDERVFFLGGMGQVSELAAQTMSQKYLGLKVTASEGYKKVASRSREEDVKVLSEIKKSKATVLFVGFGAPEQEIWVNDNLVELEEIGIKLVMVVGGAYDMISGNISRAPQWMRKVGLEWSWRLIQEPWRWRRQTALVRFWGMVFGKVFRI